MYDKTLRFLPKLPNYPHIPKYQHLRLKRINGVGNPYLEARTQKEEDVGDSPNSKVLQINNRSD